MLIVKYVFTAEAVLRQVVWLVCIAYDVNFRIHFTVIPTMTRLDLGGVIFRC